MDLCLPVARRPEAFWEMPRMTLAEGPCSQLLEKWSPEVTLGHPTREPLCTICLVMTAVVPHMR